jgi:hypothetical protein
VEEQQMLPIILHGIITADHKLEVELPADMPVGEVEIEIRLSSG